MRSLGPILLAFGALGLSDAAPGQVEQQAVQQRRQTETEKTALRERLRQQFNLILETRETARGLIVDLGDALFDPGKSSLKPGGEKLAKVAGILLAYPGLKVRLEGRTDAVGTRERDGDLAGQRAGAVRDYLSGAGRFPRQHDRDRRPGSTRPGSLRRGGRRPRAELPRGDGGFRRTHRHRGRRAVRDGVLRARAMTPARGFAFGKPATWAAPEYR